MSKSLLVVTFTEKAARELTTRISNRLAELDIQFNLNKMYLGIFHSICLRLLQAASGAPRFKHSFTLTSRTFFTSASRIFVSELLNALAAYGR